MLLESMYFFTGDDLGLGADPSDVISLPMNPAYNGSGTPEDYVFMHTNSHHEFMDLLLEKRKELENAITSKEQERRLLWTEMNGGSKNTGEQNYSLCAYR
jgi:hypothetical protein